MNDPKWPLWCWSLQFLPAALLIILSISLLNTEKAVATNAAPVFVAFTIGTAWALVVLATISFRKTRRWILSSRREWGLTAITLVLCAAAFDAALNYFGVVRTIEDQRARSLVFTLGRYTTLRLLPKEISLDDKETIQINKRGFRGNEIVVNKPPGQVRILFLGGSQVFDYTGGDWPAMVGKELRREGLNVEVINAGVPGHTTFDSLGKLLTDLWTLKPDIIFLCNGWNDFKYFRWLSPSKPFRGLPPTEPQSWQSDWRLYPSGIDRLLSYSAVYRNFRWRIGQLLYEEEGIRVVLAERYFATTEETADWGQKQYQLNLDMIVGLSRSIGARLVFCKQAHHAVSGGTGPDQEVARQYGIRNTQLSHNDLMRAFKFSYRYIDKIAERETVYVSDMHAELSGRKKYFSDGIHFTPAGSRAASKFVARTIRPFVIRSTPPVSVQ